MEQIGGENESYDFQDKQDYSHLNVEHHLSSHYSTSSRIILFRVKIIDHNFTFEHLKP